MAACRRHGRSSMSRRLRLAFRSAAWSAGLLLAFALILSLSTARAAPTPAGSLEGWEDLGGPVLEQPSCVSWGPGRLDCFARGTANILYHAWWDGQNWAGWEDLGGVLLEVPSCVSWGPNRLDCFARGADAGLMHRAWDGQNWLAWEDLGGSLLDRSSGAAGARTGSAASPAAPMRPCGTAGGTARNGAAGKASAA